MHVACRNRLEQTDLLTLEMKWVYILRCKDGLFYVGETKRLYRRIWEHSSGCGGANTSIHCPEAIVAIYKAERMGKFFQIVQRVQNGDPDIYFREVERCLESFNDTCEESYWQRREGSERIENLLTERLMASGVVARNMVRGGKYIRYDCIYQRPEDPLFGHLPMCSCGLPCDVAKNDAEGYLYFRCAKKNMWSELAEAMEDSVDVEDEPCHFFAKYHQQAEYNTKNQELKQRITRITGRSPWISSLVGGMHEHCVGGCGKTYDGANTVRYNGRAINLCFDCFANKNDELAKKYRKCLVDISAL